MEPTALEVLFYVALTAVLCVVVIRVFNLFSPREEPETQEDWDLKQW